MDNYPQIDSINSTIVGIYNTKRKANKKARRFFFGELRLTDNGESENGGYYDDHVNDHSYINDGWEDEVHVLSRNIDTDIDIDIDSDSDSDGDDYEDSDNDSNIDSNDDIDDSDE